MTPLGSRTKGPKSCVSIKVREVNLGASSLNKSDAFILDGGKDQNIFVYMPEGASSMERFKAISG